MVAVAFFALGITSGGLTYSYSVVTVILNQEFHVSQFQLMLPMTLMTLAGTVLSPVIGPKVDRYPIKWFMLAGACSLALGLLLISFAPAMSFVTAVYALVMPLVHAMMGTLCCSVLVSRWFSKRLSLAMGIASVGLSVGGFVLPPLINFLCDSFGWREAFQWMSLMVLVVMLPLAALVVDRPDKKGLRIDNAAPQLAEEKSAVQATGHFNNTSTILRNRNFWLIGFTVAILFSTYTALLSNLMPLVLRRGVDAHEGALLVSLISGVAIAGKLLFGVISERIELRIMLAATIVLVIAGMAIYLFGQSYTHFVIGSVVFGLAVGNMLPVWGALIAAFFGVANYGRVMGLMGSLNVILNVMALPFIGALFDLTGSYAVPIGVFMGLLLVSLLAVPAIRKREPSGS